MFRITRHIEDGTHVLITDFEPSRILGDAFSKERLKRFPWLLRGSIKKLAAYQLPSGLKERLLSEFPFDRMSNQQIDECIIEFKKFIAVLIINRKSRKRVAMTSEIVDEVWHSFILFTISYEKFSQDVYGRYIHHTPKTSDNPLPVDSAKNFYDTYRAYFGELHPLWKLRIKKSTVSMSEKGMEKGPGGNELETPEALSKDAIGLHRGKNQHSKSSNLKALGIASLGISPAMLQSSNLPMDPSPNVGLGLDSLKVVQYQLSSNDHFSGISDVTASSDSCGSCGGESGCGGDGGGCSGCGGCGCGGCG